MKIDPFGDVVRIRNNQDADHCTQYALLAALETLGDHRLNEENVDDATGYKEGGTWPYTMIGWLGSHGYLVRHFEDTDFDLFRDDPVAEFRRQGLDEATIDAFVEISDFDFEQAALGFAQGLPTVELVPRRPELADILEGLSNGWMPLLSLDATTLDGGEFDEFDGHIVLVTAADDHNFRIQDPGPPAKWDWLVDQARVIRALRTPSESSGTVTLIRRQVPSS